MTDQDTLILYHSWSMLTVVSIISLIGAGFSFYWAIESDDYHPACFGAILVVPLLAVWLKIGGRKGPQVIIDSRGIHDLQDHDVLIPWEHINEVWVKHVYRGGASLCLKLVPSHKDAYHAPGRLFRKLNSALGFGDVAIGLSFLTWKGSLGAHIRRLVRSHNISHVRVRDFL